MDPPSAAPVPWGASHESRMPATECLLHGVLVHLDDTEEEDVQVRDGQIIKARQGPSEHAAQNPIRELLAATTPAISLTDPSRTPSPITPSEQRLQVLAMQGALWADDEIRFHLRQLTRACPSVDQWLEPLAAFNLRSRDDVDQVASWLQTNGMRAKYQAVIVSVVRAQAHWIPVVRVKCGATLESVSCSSSQHGVQALQKASEIIARAWQCHDLKVDHRVRSSTGFGTTLTHPLHSRASLMTLSVSHSAPRLLTISCVEGLWCWQP